MSKKQKKRCETCRHFEPYYDKGDKPPYTGDCNRYPPVWTGAGCDHDWTSPIDQDRWNVPHVGAMHRCGEWKRVKR